MGSEAVETCSWVAGPGEGVLPHCGLSLKVSETQVHHLGLDFLKGNA